MIGSKQRPISRPRQSSPPLIRRRGCLCSGHFRWPHCLRFTVLVCLQLPSTVDVILSAAKDLPSFSPRAFAMERQAILAQCPVFCVKVRAGLRPARAVSRPTSATGRTENRKEILRCAQTTTWSYIESTSIHAHKKSLRNARHERTNCLIRSSSHF